MLRNGLGVGGSVLIGIVIGTKYNERLQAIIKLTSSKLDPSSLSRESRPDDVLTNPTSFIRKAVSLSDSGTYAVLSTCSTSAQSSLVTPHARVIQPFPMEYTGDGSLEIYFNTSKFSRKVNEITLSPRISLTYFKEGNMSCVTYTGTCERVPYPESSRHWRDWLLLFYPEGPNEEEGSRFTTWRIKPDSVELLSLSEGLVSHRPDSRPPQAVLHQSTDGMQWKIICDGKQE